MPPAIASTSTAETRLRGPVAAVNKAAMIVIATAVTTE